MDDQDDYYCLDDQDDYHERGVDHNHDADQCCLDDQDNYREYGVDHIHDPDQWNQINTCLLLMILIMTTYDEQNPDDKN